MIDGRPVMVLLLAAGAPLVACMAPPDPEAPYGRDAPSAQAARFDQQVGAGAMLATQHVPQNAADRAEAVRAWRSPTVDGSDAVPDRVVELVLGRSELLLNRPDWAPCEAVLQVVPDPTLDQHLYPERWLATHSSGVQCRFGSNGAGTGTVCFGSDRAPHSCDIWYDSRDTLDSGFVPPTDPVGAARYVSMSVGHYNACLRTPEGEVKCIGLGPETAPVAAERFEQVGTASPDLACGRRADGTVRCWGPEAQGELAAPAGTYIDQCVGPFHWCGLTAEGEVRCLGEDLYGETQVPEGPTYAALGCNLESTCVALVGGGVRCYGRHADDVLRPPADLEAQQVVVHTRTACALLRDGAVRCWGDAALSRSPDGVYDPALVSVDELRRQDLLRRWP